jgi:hypothetical protein
MGLGWDVIDFSKEKMYRQLQLLEYESQVKYREQKVKYFVWRKSQV